jgi:glycosyltransferase involved in cell wall biosynthesis
MLKIQFIISIKNRHNHLSNLIERVRCLKNVDYAFCIVDFQSEDCDYKTLEAEEKFQVKILKEDFNLGKGWNKAAEMANQGILCFLTNDCLFEEDLVDLIAENTKEGESFFAPEHICVHKDGKEKFLGGGCLWSIYKSDFEKSNGFIESTTWGDAGNQEGEDSEFMRRYSKILKMNRFKCKSIKADFHERDMSEKWYRESKRFSKMTSDKNRFEVINEK